MIGRQSTAGDDAMQVPPRYPEEAKRNRISGTAQFSVLVGPDGGIVKMIALGGPTELVQAAADAVRKWRYEPILLNGKPCYVLTAVDVNFTLSR